MSILSATPSSAQDSGKKYALLVGVETYDPAFLDRLSFAEDEVLDLGRELELHGFGVTNLTSQSANTHR